MDVKSLPPISRTFTARIARGMKITIPLELRKLLNIEPKDYVTLYLSVLIRQGERVVPIDHIPKTQRTFSKIIYHDNKTAPPTDLIRLLNLREGDYVTLTIVNITKRTDLPKEE